VTGNRRSDVAGGANLAGVSDLNQHFDIENHLCATAQPVILWSCRDRKDDDDTQAAESTGTSAYRRESSAAVLYAGSIWIIQRGIRGQPVRADFRRHDEKVSYSFPGWKWDRSSLLVKGCFIRAYDTNRRGC